MAITFEYYQRLIDKLRLRSRAYRVVFNPALGETKVVLKDICKFAHLHDTPYQPDEKLTYVMIGRQEMAQRIIRHLQLQPDALYALLDGREVTAPTAPIEGHAEHD